MLSYAYFAGFFQRPPLPKTTRRKTKIAPLRWETNRKEEKHHFHKCDVPSSKIQAPADPHPVEKAK